MTVIFLTEYSGSGKSTIYRGTFQSLTQSEILDGGMV